LTKQEVFLWKNTKLYAVNVIESSTQLNTNTIEINDIIVVMNAIRVVKRYNVAIVEKHLKKMDIVLESILIISVPFLAKKNMLVRTS